MPIKFSCPNCAKSFTVKDQLAGKRANCPACKKPLSVPKPSAASAAPPEMHVEDMAAAALMDAPAAPPPPVAEAKTVTFNCPQCDEPVTLSADLEGKQTPCPHCARIIK